MPLDFGRIPKIDESIHHFERDNLVRTLGQVGVNRNVKELINIVESMSLHAIRVLY